MPGWPWTWRGAALRALGAFVLLNLLIIYVPISPLTMLAIVAISTMAALLDYRKLLPLVASLTFVTLLFEAAVRLIASEALNPYYRPHEILALETSYKPNARVDMDVPHGDMLVIDSSLPRELAETRHELFVTDSHGYRNDKDYSGEPLVLVGDSFMVGTDTNLSMDLEARGLDAYNVSFSGLGPLIYADKIRWVRETLAPASCVVLFFFEGNDFQPRDAMNSTTRDNVPRGVQLAVKGYVNFVRGRFEWSRVFYGLWTRSLATLAGAARTGQDGPTPREETTFVASVGGQPMAFLRGYADVVRRPSYDDGGFIRNRLMANPPDLLVFIPDKYRVYGPLLDDGAVTSMPHAQWEYLRNAAGDLSIEAVDLTPALIRRSRELLATKAVTYWRGDTHWNSQGENVAADVLVEALASSRTAACADVDRARQ